MHVSFIKQEILYTGEQLKSLFIRKQTGLEGNGIIAFMGPCSVKPEFMVDQEDKEQKAVIYSPLMLHFLVEIFAIPISEIILWQRLLIANIMELIMTNTPNNNIVINRKGDDIYCNNKKLSISIATVSPLSGLIHTGLNIKTENVPVPAIGLEELKLDPNWLAPTIMDVFCKEYRSIEQSKYKVNWVD